jgi:hypothetical protein
VWFNSTQIRRGETIYWEMEFIVIFQLQRTESLIINFNFVCNQTIEFRKANSQFCALISISKQAIRKVEFLN